MDSKKVPYYPVASSEDVSSPVTDDYGRSSREIPLYSHQSPKKRLAWIPTPLTASIVVLNILITVAIITVLTWKPSDQQCTKQLSAYSPALEAVEYIEYDFANEFNSTSIYRGPPTHEREEAWFNLTFKHAIEVPGDRIAALNRSGSDNLRHVPQDTGTGYIALLEVFHQLHCLNMIRAFTWYQAGNYHHRPYVLTGDPVADRLHVDHCIETLRLALMCFGDVSPMFVRLGGVRGSKADFNVHHKCRNFDKIEGWIDENWTVY